MDPITLIAGLVSVVPNLLKLFGASSDTATAAQSAVNVATAVAGVVDPQAAVAAIAADPQLQQQMQTEIDRHIEQMAQVAASDRASARSMQIATRSLVAPFLALAVTFGFFGILSLMMFYRLPPETHDALMLMLGALGTAWTGVIGYYFGSSAGSDRKTELMAGSQ